jgi:hypothetical protein
MEKIARKKSTTWDRLSVGHGWVLSGLVAGAAEISNIWLVVAFYLTSLFEKRS